MYFYCEYCSSPYKKQASGGSLLGRVWRDGWLQLHVLHESSPVTLEYFIAFETSILCSGIACLFKVYGALVRY